MDVRNRHTWYWVVQATLLVSVNVITFARICPAMAAIKAAIHRIQPGECWLYAASISVAQFAVAIAGDLLWRWRERRKAP
jgi:hypothetical protein